MKNKDLIEALKKLDPEKEVCIFDFRKNIGYDSGHGSREGIYSMFIVKETKQRISLYFENEDYEEDGTFINPYYK